jgi:NitT/TauT family transport system ATP-binding protein
MMRTDSTNESRSSNLIQDVPNGASWISVEGLNKVYFPKKSEPTHALSGIDFSIKQGEFISIVGPSGCGKTTLLNILAGLISKTSGSAKIAGHEVVKPLKEVGMVFQAPTLLPWRTIKENIMIPVEVQKLDKESHLQRADDLIKLVGLDGFENKYPNELSGGMQQRAGICRALVHSPAVLLMDEPFGALDAMTREYMNLELIRIWQESKQTILFVTHSISEAVFLSDRVIVLSPRPGRIAEIIDINIPRTRDLAIMSSDEAGVYVKRIRKYFSASSVIE